MKGNCRGVVWVAVGMLTAGACGGGNAGGKDADGIVDVNSALLGGARMMVPAYFLPSAGWQRVLDAKSTVRMIVFNPDSGPGASASPQYQQAVKDAQAAGIRVLGYVATDYGKVPQAKVLADIEAYYQLYAPSGIYLAEGPAEKDCAGMEALYSSYAGAAKAKDPHAYLAVGTRFCPTYITFMDMMVQFARGWQEYQSTYTPPSWMPANSPERFCHIIHDVPPAELGTALELAARNGAGWIYITDGTAPNPWGALPSYFDDEVKALTAAP